MARKLFCELGPWAYSISLAKNRLLRHAGNFFGDTQFAQVRRQERLPVVLYRHKSLIRRRLGDVDPVLQDNKAQNLALAAARVDGLVLEPGQCFSFWRLVGPATRRRGYKTGLVIKQGKPDSDIGGGLCQFTNLIHWMVLHTPFAITERHHHNNLDLFPDFGRQIPFGTGTSVLYNYLDYRFCNNWDAPVQLVVYTTDTHLCGELRSTKRLPSRYHIFTQGERFVRQEGVVYRTGRVMRECIDPVTGNKTLECLQENRARVLYDTAHLTVENTP